MPLSLPDTHSMVTGAELPVALAVALRLRRAGESDAVIATALAIEPTGVKAIIELAETKLRRSLSEQQRAVSSSPQPSGTPSRVEGQGEEA